MIGSSQLLLGSVQFNIALFMVVFFASLAADVVFPEPCNPTNNSETGGTALKLSHSFLVPNILTSSS